jgi:hypothetical protein
VPFEQFRQEQLYVLLLDQKNRVTHDVMVYKGTVNAINIRPAELFMEAVRYNSPSIIMSHCHPSGNSTPSPVIWRKSQISKMAVLGNQQSQRADVESAHCHDPDRSQAELALRRKTNSRNGSPYQPNLPPDTLLAVWAYPSMILWTG